jgi:hypothetical protein
MRRLTSLVALALAGCGGYAAASTTKLAHWRTDVEVKGPVDVVVSQADGSLVIATGGRLFVQRPSGALKPFASSYRASGGEPYIAVAPPGCFGAGTVYALKLQLPQGVIAIAPHSRPRLLAKLKAPGLANGITFDSTGHFAHRLLVTVNARSGTTVYSIGCKGDVRIITAKAPRMEGGIVVAPASFGRFGGDLIAPDELSGRIFAITPTGHASRVVSSGLPFGQDLGVESEGFVPSGPGRYHVFLADRLTPGNPHPGDDVILELGSAALRAAGVGGGDLLVATEGGALVDVVSCGRRSCHVREVASGPKVAHAEGHIAVLRS